MTTPVPALPAWVPGMPLSYEDMLTQVSDTYAFWQDKVIFRASQDSTPTTLTDTPPAAVVIFDTVAEDPYSGYDISNGTWLAPVSGWYQITAAVSCASVPSSNAILQAYVQTNYGSWIIAAVPLVTPSPSVTIALGTWMVYLIEGLDSFWVAGELINATGTALTDVTGGVNSRVQAVWLMA